LIEDLESNSGLPCTSVEDVGVDSLFPLRPGTEEFEFDGGLVIGVGDIKKDGVSSLSVGDIDQFVGGLVTCVDGVLALVIDATSLLQ
jgi:hypothetical protein